MNAWIHTFFGGQEVSSTLHPLYRGGVSRLNTGLAKTTSLASQLGLGGVPSLCLLSTRITGDPPQRPSGHVGPGDPNSSPPVCAADVLPAESSPQRCL